MSTASSVRALRPARLALLFGLAAVAACTSPADVSPRNADDLLIVDCLLPPRIRALGRSATYLEARKAVRTSAVDCRIRGGEYVAHDRASYATALSVWLPLAKSGDPEAQNYVGEIFERGLGRGPDYEAAAHWFRLAAEQGFAPAQINLGQLYDEGLGVPRDPDLAHGWFRRASGLEAGDAGFARTPGPSIQILDPPIPLQRGIALVAAPAASRRVVVGRVQAPAGLSSLEVNGRALRPADTGLFRVELEIPQEALEVLVVARDERGRRAERRFELSPLERARAAAPPAPPSSDEGFGDYHALVIGNDDYRSLPDLSTAWQDALAISNLLSRRYGFEVTTLHDASRYQILSALNQLRTRLDEGDNLLLYYAGHGELDEVNMRGHWLPTDAERESSANWISNIAVTDMLNAMRARHVMVVADTCYSGTLTSASLPSPPSDPSPDAREAWIAAMREKRSRTALSSGGLAPVLDTGGARHSVFARELIDVLERNHDVLDGQRLFREIAARVTWAAQALDFDQVPEYAPIRYAGHESGDFFLVPVAP